MKNDIKKEKIQRVDYDEDTDLVDVLDNLIYLKEEVFCSAYTDFKGVRYDNRNVDELKKLRNITAKPTLKYNPKNNETDNKHLINSLVARKSSNESIQYWVNQAANSLDTALKDGFEYQCYYYLSIDKNNFYTIKYACYFLYILQAGNLEKAKEVLDRIMLEVDNRFNYKVFYDLTLSYTNYVGYLSSIYEKLVPPIDKDEELDKIKRLIYKH